jgi:hypothetical protein
MSDGCEQRERYPAALAPGYFRVDETSFETRVAMSAGLASYLRFIGLDQADKGSWGELFDGDEALVIARMLATDLEALKAAFVRDADTAPLVLLAQRVIALALLIDDWLKALKASEQTAARTLTARIEQLVAQPLAEDLRWVLVRFGLRRLEGVRLARVKPRLDAVWFPPRRALRTVQAQRSDRERLRGRYFSFISAIGRLQALARELLPTSLVSQTHAPAAGLLMAFLQLFEVAQARINRFTDRHADFYHDDCLRMQPLPAVPDRLHLVCERDPRVALEVVVERGTRFAAGKDAGGRVIEFEADETLVVTDARVAALCTLRLDRDPLISPEHEFGYVTRSEAARLPWPPSAPPAPGAPLPHWSLFGGSTATRSGNSDSREGAQFGLAIASPLLLLGEGERAITLTLGLLHPADADAQLTRLAARLASSARAMRRLLPVLFKRYLLLAPELIGSDRPQAIDALACRLARQVLFGQSLGEPDTARASSVQPADLYPLFLTELCIASPSAELFRARLGRLFARWLLARGDWLSERQLQALRDTATALLGASERTAPTLGDPRCLFQGPDRPEDGIHRPERELIYAQFFNSFFSFSLSTPAGWLEVTDSYVAAATGSPLPGLQIVLRLRPEDPPITACTPATHGPDWPTEQPLLCLRLRSHGRIYAYSLFENVLLADVTLNVQVWGLRDIVLHNQLGRLDPGKPFMPFGPLPSTASYLVFGAPEMASKNVTRLRVNLEWSGLPADEGGFAYHYGGYGVPLRNESFTVAPGILRDGQWQDAALSGPLTLFVSADASERLGSTSRLVIDEAALRTHGRATADALDFMPGLRNGHYRLQLSGPALAFGHQAYPGLLTSAVSANATLLRKRPMPLPNAPYTPLVERMTLDYEAESHLALHRDASADEGRAALERVLRLHPFGLQQIYPADQSATPTLMPQLEHDGNLYIGLQASELQGPLKLHFQMRDEDAVESPLHEGRPAIHWSCLAADRWQALPASSVVSDTTGGFLTSGIVTLDLPPGIERGNTLLPAAYAWLRVGASGRLDAFAGLVGVRAQALQATRVLGGGSVAALATLPAGSVKGPVVTLPGLAAVQQIGPSFGLRLAEDRLQMRTRVGERLQHKQRACTPWDYERLVLEQFPAVLKVRCFPHLSVLAEGVSPGSVLVVVVPRPRAEAAPVGEEAGTAYVSATAEPHLNAIELERIRDHLRQRASPFVQLQVRNAVFERVQVRCTVKLARDAQAGLALRRVNRAIVDFISPWRSPGYGPSFDWVVRCEDIEAQVRALDCIESVTQVSLLHVAKSDDGVYSLGDTARSTAELATRVRPRSPWSLVLPLREHIVNVVPASTFAPPEPTGIARLGISNTFIVARSS